MKGTRAAATSWLLDHGAHWTECVGDALARPWFSLSRWCYRQWVVRREGEKDAEPITADECRRIRIALIFGDPAGEDQANPNLERAKAKLLAIEMREP